MKFSAVPGDDTFLWVDRMASPALCEKFQVWSEDLVSTGYKAYVEFGVPLMSETERKDFEQFDTLVKPSAINLYKVTRDEFAKGLGFENALAVDINGDAVDFSAPPEKFQPQKLLRLAYLNQVRDRALLAKSWDDYFKSANEWVGR